MEVFGEDIWIMEGECIRMYGIPFTTRMTVVRLLSGGLWIHSPITLTKERFLSVREYGTIEFLVAPNKLHSLWLESWSEQEKQAEVWVSPQFKVRHSESKLRHASVLTDETPSKCQADLEQVIFQGSFILDEVVFFHRRSATLIVTDLIQRHDPLKNPWFWRIIKKCVGVLGEGGGVAKDLRMTFRDRKAARRSLDRVLQWDFNKVIIAHGFCITDHAREKVEEAFEWL